MVGPGYGVYCVLQGVGIPGIVVWETLVRVYVCIYRLLGPGKMGKRGLVCVWVYTSRKRGWRRILQHSAEKRRTHICLVNQITNQKSVICQSDNKSIPFLPLSSTFHVPLMLPLCTRTNASILSIMPTSVSWVTLHVY